MMDDPLAGLQRPVPHARNYSESSMNVAMNTPTNVAASAAPIVDTTTAPAPAAPPPLIDTTKFGRSSSRQRSFTRIEGMEKLERPIMDGTENMSEADKRMKEEELSFYSASDNDHGDDNIWGLLSGVGGNIYEWYVIIGCFSA